MQKQLINAMRRWLIVLILLFNWGGQVQPVAAGPTPVPYSIVVNSSLDDPDAANDDYCETANGNRVCTLRAAIQHANYQQSINGTLITFNIPNDVPLGPTTISVRSALPWLTVNGTTIQGPNTADNSMLVLDGSDGAYVGLEIRANDCGIKNLTVSNFGGYGVVVGASTIPSLTGTVITGNRIGDLVPLTFADNSNGGGIKLINAGSSFIGGDTSTERNIISGNTGYGISINGGGTNVVRGNYIGVNSVGTAELANTMGIYIKDSTGNTIGGNTPGARNVISGNTAIGVFLDASDNVVTGNTIGTNAAGTVVIPNGGGGVKIGQCGGSTSYNNRVGGTLPGEGNLISGNVGRGIGVYCSDGALIKGNIIGLNAAQDAALPNEWGVTVDTSLNTFIGGAEAGAGNVISGNTRQGIFVGEETVNTSIKGNRIGVNSSDAPFGNGMDGIMVQYTVDAPIGGNGLAANIIANNGDNGIEIESAFPLVGNNSIYNNANLGIDVWKVFGPAGQVGVTPNDADEADGIQNFPVFSSIGFLPSGKRQVSADLHTLKNETIDIHIYGSPSCDPSGHGEGQVHISTFQVTTNSSGWINFAITGDPIPQAIFYTVTAYSYTLGQSEFSPCIAVSTFLPVIMR